MNLETKQFTIEDIEVKQDGDVRTVEGFASVFNNIDSYKDIVLPGAFTKTLKKNRTIPMLWQHDSDEVVGVWTELEERDRGLYVKGTIVDTSLGLDAYKLLKAGAITGMSIGYSTKGYEIDNDKGVRKLSELELYEVSLVTFPANEKAKVTSVKSLEGLQFDSLHQHKRMVEAALRDAGASDQLATYVASLIPKPASRDEVGEAEATQKALDALSLATKTLKGL